MSVPLFRWSGLTPLRHRRGKDEVGHRPPIRLPGRPVKLALADPRLLDEVAGHRPSSCQPGRDLLRVPFCNARVVVHRLKNRVARVVVTESTVVVVVVFLAGPVLLVHHFRLRTVVRTNDGPCAARQNRPPVRLCTHRWSLGDRSPCTQCRPRHLGSCYALGFRAFDDIAVVNPERYGRSKPCVGRLPSPFDHVPEHRPLVGDVDALWPSPSADPDDQCLTRGQWVGVVVDQTSSIGGRIRCSNGVSDYKRQQRAGCVPPTDVSSPRSRSVMGHAMSC